MGQRSKGAATQTARILNRREECALGMGQSTNYVLLSDAQLKQGREECALSMGQRSCAAATGVIIYHSREDCV